MDNRLQATFMPRQAPGADTYVRPKGPPNFLMGIGLVIILLVGAAWGGLFFYKGYIAKANDEKQTQIEAAIKNFNPDLNKKLTVLKARLDAGQTLMSKHVAFTGFLDLLAANTVQTVQFTDMTYTTGDDGKITIVLKGASHSYNAIAFQSDVFSKIPQLQMPVFSGLTLDSKGIINFIVTAGLDPSVVSYATQFGKAPTIPIPADKQTTSSGTKKSSTPPPTTPPPAQPPAPIDDVVVSPIPGGAGGPTTP